jgi:hypothetical protein
MRLDLRKYFFSQKRKKLHWKCLKIFKDMKIYTKTNFRQKGRNFGKFHTCSKMGKGIFYMFGRWAQVVSSFDVLFRYRTEGSLSTVDVDNIPFSYI